jgi:hypothetical protein
MHRKEAGSSNLLVEQFLVQTLKPGDGGSSTISARKRERRCDRRSEPSARAGCATGRGLNHDDGGVIGQRKDRRGIDDRGEIGAHVGLRQKCSISTAPSSAAPLLVDEHDPAAARRQDHFWAGLEVVNLQAFH